MCIILFEATYSKCHPLLWLADSGGCSTPADGTSWQSEQAQLSINRRGNPPGPYGFPTIEKVKEGTCDFFDLCAFFPLSFHLFNTDSYFYTDSATSDKCAICHLWFIGFCQLYPPIKTTAITISFLFIYFIIHSTHFIYYASLLYFHQFFLHENLRIKRQGTIERHHQALTHL